MTSLARKLLRDLRHAWPQVLSITSVLAAGITSLVSLQGTMVGLERARDLLYDATGFADAEVRLERAPEGVGGALAQLPGVRAAETRLVVPATVPMPGDPLPPYGVLVSLPPARPDARNRVLVLQGRLPERGGEALLLARFAARYGVRPGDRLALLVRGARRELRISGLATSAEYVVPRGSAAGMGGDEERFAVLWLPRDDLAAIADLDGAFNDVLFSLDPARPWPEVRAAIDGRLAPFGGLGAFDRARQPSEEILRGEFAQLRGMATVLPLIFLGVAAFLVNVVVSRLITLQRPEIAALAALGYGRGRIAGHFLQFVAVIAVLGAAVGLGAGAWLGQALVRLYADYFHLPQVAVRLSPGVVTLALAASVGACVLGALSALRAILRLAPADAMRPPAPARYRLLLVDRLRAFAGLAPTVRMIARDVERQPARAALSIAGLGAAIGMLIAGRFNADAIPALLDLQFGRAAREDVSLAFLDPAPPSAITTLQGLPGVLRAEGFRAVPVRLRSGAVLRDAAIIAYDADARLRRLVDLRGRVVPMPADGVLLSRPLAERLHLRAGDPVQLEVREGRRRELVVRVTGIVDDLVGVQAYADPDVLARWLGEHRVYSAAAMTVDPAALDALQRRLAELGGVTGFTTRSEVVRRFREMMARTTGTMTLIESIFAAIIAAGLVYNSARVALSTRGRDLASLRVLGFSRREIGAMLLGEQAFYLVAAMPVGLLAGRWFVRLLLATIDVERVRIPTVVSARTDAFALAVVVATAAVTAAVIQRRIARLDLIAVLKTRE